MEKKKNNLISEIMKIKSVISIGIFKISLFQYLEMNEDDVWKELKKFNYTFQERQEIMTKLRSLKDELNTFNKQCLFEVEEIAENYGLITIKERQKRLI